VLEMASDELVVGVIGGAASPLTTRAPVPIMPERRLKASPFLPGQIRYTITRKSRR
jgi:hypothetical protein